MSTPSTSRARCGVGRRLAAAALVVGTMMATPALAQAPSDTPSPTEAPSPATNEPAPSEPQAEPTTSATLPSALTPALGLAPGEPPTLPPNVGGWPALPPTTGASVVVIDVASRTVLASRDADRLRPVASTVKMLTALTARRLESSVDRVIVAGQEVAALEGSGVGLRVGEAWTVRQLLEGMLVRSGNDAAAALAAQLIPGGTDAFLLEMRADAVRLGLDGAVLVSPSGLDDSNRLSAAHLAIVAMELLNDPVLAEIVDMTSVRLPGLGGVPNRNELVHRDPSVIGIKTGFTEASGHSLVAAAERDGRITIAVVLDAANASARFDDAERLLDHAASFTSLPVLAAVELGCAGRRVTLTPLATAVVVPTSSTSLVAVAWPPRRCPVQSSFVVTPTLQRLPLLPVEVTVQDDDSTAAPVSADGTLGRWLADTVQRAMRAVDVAELTS